MRCGRRAGRPGPCRLPSNSPRWHRSPSAVAAFARTRAGPRRSRLLAKAATRGVHLTETSSMQSEDGFWLDRRVFVTGCTGLVGGWTVEALLARGAHVVGLV